jgi:hypothetical protein
MVPIARLVHRAHAALPEQAEELVAIPVEHRKRGLGARGARAPRDALRALRTGRHRHDGNAVGIRAAKQRSSAVGKGGEATHLVETLSSKADAAEIPEAYWAVRPLRSDPPAPSDAKHAILRGAVLVSVHGQKAENESLAKASGLSLPRARAPVRPNMWGPASRLRRRQPKLRPMGVEGERQALLATVSELEQIIERHVIRAPADGVIGALGLLHPGSYVAEGARLGTLRPSGELMLVAEFEPPSALGRIRPQQRAELRLTGFPWLEFGTVNARVTQVATEVRDGTVRVELDLLREQKTLIPFQHGLPGTVEVAVEQITPAELLLRSLGRRLDSAPGNQTEPPAAP